MLLTTWVVGCLSSYAFVSILCFALNQVVVSWVAHSGAHSRDTNLNKISRVEASLIGGMSLEWWSPKHNMHHMFTNIQIYDEDIQHQYKVYLFPFLYLKWRFDSLVSTIQNKNYVNFH